METSIGLFVRYRKNRVGKAVSLVLDFVKNRINCIHREKDAAVPWVRSCGKKESVYNEDRRHIMKIEQVYAPESCGDYGN